MGVWIETTTQISKRDILSVTPYVGVWIETEYDDVLSDSGVSHPTWVCGLKHPSYDSGGLRESHTLRGCVD